METIYDHGVTEQELTVLFGPVDERETREEYFAFLSPDSAYADLYLLYRWRGQFDRAVQFLDHIQDERYRRTVGMPSCREQPLSSLSDEPTASKKSRAACASSLNALFHKLVRCGVCCSSQSAKLPASVVSVLFSNNGNPSTTAVASGIPT